FDEVAMSRREVVLERVAELWLGYESGAPGATPRDSRSDTPPVLVAHVRHARAPSAAAEPGIARYVIDVAGGRARPAGSSAGAAPGRGKAAGQGAPAPAPLGDHLHVAYDRAERL